MYQEQKSQKRRPGWVPVATCFSYGVALASSQDLICLKESPPQDEPVVLLAWLANGQLKVKRTESS